MEIGNWKEGRSKKQEGGSKKKEARSQKGLPARLLRLRQQNNEFELGIGDVAGNVGGDVAGPLHGFPGGAGLIEAEILVVELDGDGPRGRRDVG
jgi:hypothetical protein